jgi:hypothetical protein
MTKARSSHTATLLLSGKVLVVGGYGVSGPLANAEVYDPATGSFSATGGMTTARAIPTATLLLSGKVLVAGGLGTSGSSPLEIYLASAELFDGS